MTGYHAIQLIRDIGCELIADSNGKLYTKGVTDPPQLLAVVLNNKAEALEAIRDNLYTEIYTDVADVPKTREHVRHVIYHKSSGAIEIVKEPDAKDAGSV